MCSCSVCPALARPNRVNTPIRRRFAAAETVTIIDPRHPLYDRTFPLLHVKNKQNLILSCLIQLPEGVERLVPVEVTNLARSPLLVFSLPLDVSSLQNLVQTFARMKAQVEMECSDETAGAAAGPNGDDPVPSVGNAGDRTTTSDLPDGGTHLSQPRHTSGRGGEA
jgi:hypothetical protein